MIRMLDSADSTLVEWGRQQQQQVFVSAFHVRRQLFFDHPGLLFPCGVQWRTLLSCSRFMTCKIHLHRLCMTIVPRLSWLYQAKFSQLEIVSGQNMHNIPLRYLLWKADNLMRSPFVIIQHSVSYRKVGSTNTGAVFV